MNLMKLLVSIGADTAGLEAGISKTQSIVSKAGKVTAMAIGAATTAVAAFTKQAISTGADFDKSMSQVAATMGKTTDEIKELRDFAQQMGATTMFSAVQAADALNYMALAGYDAQTSMSMLPSVLDLAAAGGFELGRASDMITDSQSALGLTLEETAAMVDQMAMTASKSNTNVEQLGDAILTVGGTAQFMAGGTDRLNTVLGILADNGIKGSEAGTHLRNMINSLASPTTDAAKMISALGLQVFDAEGNMRDFADIFGDLNKKMENMTDSQKMNVISSIFNTRDMAAVSALLNTTTERWEELGGAILDSEGAAKQMADTQMDNLAGDITYLKSAFEGVQIALSDRLTPALREFVQFGSEGLSELTEAMRTGDLDGIMDSVGSILTRAIGKIIAALPKAINAGIALLKSLLKGFAQNVPQIITAAGEIVGMLAGALADFAPEVIRIGAEVAKSLLDGLSEALPRLGEQLANSLPDMTEYLLTMIQNFADFIKDNIGPIMDAGFDLIVGLAQGIIASIPALIEYVPQIIASLYNALNEASFSLVSAGIDLVVAIVTGLWQEAPNILDAIWTMVTQAGEKFAEFDWIAKGIELITKIAQGIGEIGTTIGTTLKGFLDEASKKFSEIDWLQVGKDIINGIVEGIRQLGDSIGSALAGFASSGVDKLKNLLGIASPSKVFRDEVGKWIPLGIAEGIEENMKYVEQALDGVGDFTVGTNVTASENSIGSGFAGVTQYLTVQSPTQLSPSEVAKQTRDANREMILSLRGV